MIVQNNKGNWDAKCDLCQWAKTTLKRNNAENKFRNHINMVHKNGLKGIKQQKRPMSRYNLPPNIPKSIKEH